ncbi:UGSC family (seleno)protein [Chloroflexota bacterium]
MAAEKAGVPTASIACQGFVVQGKATVAAVGMHNLPISTYPGQIPFHSTEELENNVQSVLVDQIIQALTVQPKEVKQSSEPAPRDIVFKGTFEEVNRFFYEKEWSEGLPIIPPTMEKVGEFLKYTVLTPDQVIGRLLPDNREATVWNIAVNGVMAGCRPEYMPVLIAIVEAMVDHKFGQEHLGHTPGTEVLITVNGPIIKELGFNYEQGALRVGFQANTSIGRFWRLYLRNVAGFLPHKTDKGTFGGTWRVVLAENEDAASKIGWEPMSVDQGFKAGDNVITLNSCTSSDSVMNIGADRVEETLDKLAARIVDTQLPLFVINLLGPGVRPQIMISPCIAEAAAEGGYSKDKVKQYLYEHTTFTAKRYEHLFPHLALCNAVAEGKLPKQYCESTDPDRMVPLVSSPEDFLITVSGDPGRDNCFVCSQNGFIGYPVSKKIELPANWEELLKEARKK